ncbi:MAG: protein kinase domain-containing protein [Pyrinomonadaceae bacterium]
MAHENWQQVREIFDSALRRKPEERRAFVHAACGEDKLLRAEVESLLSSLDSAESFMETPAVAEVAGVIAAETKLLAPGTCFGHYEIIKQIGAGGMGEVYLAVDKKLDRQVAVKMLNAQFKQKAANLGRFIQEAKAASALNHPNILVIHEIGEADEAHFIVSEFIEGQTLREVIRAASLSLAELLDISIQIAAALAAAHTAHLVHRDIKPENIMIRPDGFVKILDFGLAKLVAQKNRSVSELEGDSTKQNQTAQGVILGTVNYMSPEQAKGELVDERTDIFSFGVVLYEMLAGRTPFASSSMSETFANLINAEPQPLVRLAEGVPDELQSIVARMLCKNRDERYQRIKYLISDLTAVQENLKAEKQVEKSPRPEDNNQTDTITVATNRDRKQALGADWHFAFAFKHHRKNFIIYSGVALIASILSLSLFKFSTSKNTNEPFRQVRLNRLTNIGNVGNFALSPDGNLMAYETKEKEGVSIWVRQIEMSNAVNLVPLKKGNITFLTFSPDGRLVYYGFFSGYDSTEELYSVPTLGGASRKVPDTATNFMSFAPDGKHYAQVASNLKEGEKYLVINMLGSKEEIRLAMRKAPSSFNILGQFCAWSPDGKMIAAISNDTDADGHFSTLVGVSVADGAEKPLSAKRWNELNSVQWLKDGGGLLVIGSDTQQARSQIWFVSAADGAAHMLTNDLNDYSYLGVTANGKQIVAVQESRTSGIWLGTVGQTANDFNELISETGTLDTIVLTADDNIIFRSHADGKPNLWTIGTDGGGRRQITIDAEVDERGLCVTPAAGQIVFPSRKAGKINLWRVNVDGSDARQLTFGDGEFYPNCLPDNGGVIYQKGSGYGIKSTLWKIPPAGGQPTQLTDYYAIRPALSPDGRHVAFFYITNGKWRIGTVSADGGGIEQNFAVPAGVLDRILRWSPDGQSLFYIANEGNVGNVWSLPLNGQLPRQVTKFNSHLLADFALTQRGKRAVVTRTVKLSDVVIISEG